ncbi:MAG: hypothetical protein WBB34_18410 [Xanthobacteraceae bacterium]
MHFDRLIYRLGDALGYSLCELAFKTSCRGPFAWSYRAGCWCYGKATDAGVRSGDLVVDAQFRPGGDAPLYVGRT